MKSYPEYQTTNIVWMSSVPKDWQIRPLAFAGEVVNGYPFDSKKFDPTKGHPLVRIRDIYSETTETQFDGDWVDAAEIETNDVLIGMDGDFNVAVWKGGKALLNQRVCCVRTGSPELSRYLSFVLPLPLNVTNELTYATTVKHLSSFDVLKYRVPIPTKDEVSAIVDYLATETKRIDGLIEEKVNLHKLVKALSIALLDEAVEGKREIHGSAPYEAWGKARLRFKAKVNPRASMELEDEKHVSFLPMEAIGEDGSLRLDETRKVADVSQGYTYFEEGDVTIAKITPCFENRKGAVMSGLDGGVGFGTTELIVLRPEDDVDAKYLYYVTQSSRFRLNGEASMTGSGGQKRVSDLYVKDYETKWPPLDSQKIIAAYIDTQLEKNADLIRHVETELDLLKELRASTITDAVLGRIDVRQVAEDQ